MPHMTTKHLHDGTLEVLGNFADPEPEETDGEDED
jgi:hypothetical protein